MLTQGVLLLNQVVLLPIQIRIWGHIATAHWYTMLAIATIVSVSDCGLRTAGHAELIRYAHNPADQQAKIDFQPHAKRQKIVDSWPMDVDDSPARRDWGWQPDYDQERCFSNYLVPEIKKRYQGG